MATVNLGNIKFNWEGAYRSDSFYSINDVVSSAGSSYICIKPSRGNAPTNTSYWEIMSALGGTLDTVLTAHGDLLYRDATGLERLPAGGLGQILTTGGPGADPSWETHPDVGNTIYITQYNNSVRTVLTDQTGFTFYSAILAQQKNNSKFRVDVQLVGWGNGAKAVNFHLVFDSVHYYGISSYPWTAQNSVQVVTGTYYIPGSVLSGMRAWSFEYDMNGQAAGKPFSVWNPRTSEDAHLTSTQSSVIFTEYSL